MNKLFEEQMTVGWIESAPPLSVWGNVVAYFDSSLSLLVIDCTASCATVEEDWLPQSQRIVETVANTTHYPLRRIVEVADQWYASVKAAIPAPETPLEEEMSPFERALKRSNSVG